MSSVTASALIGSSPRYRGCIEPDTIALLHEGRSAAWQFIDLFGDAEADPETTPSRRWVQCNTPADTVDMLRLGIHLWASDPASDVADMIRAGLSAHGLLAQDRIDLATLADHDRQELVRLAHTPPGAQRTMMLTIYGGMWLATPRPSVFDIPGWQGEWARPGGGQTFGYLIQEWRHH